MKKYYIKKSRTDEPVVIHASEHLKKFFTEEEQLSKGYPLVALRLNNEIYSLNAHPDMNGIAKPVYLNSSDGIRLYRRSLCYLLEMAVRDLFPLRRLILGHSLGHSYYYHTHEDPSFSEEEIESIKHRMNQLVSEDLGICPDTVNWQEAMEYFEKKSPGRYGFPSGTEMP